VAKRNRILAMQVSEIQLMVYAKKTRVEGRLGEGTGPCFGPDAALTGLAMKQGMKRKPCACKDKTCQILCSDFALL